jgi:DNA replication protein DnaC
MRKFEGLIEKGFDDRDHGKVLDILISCPVLVLDDLGKERLTQRLESDLFAVLDERTSNLRTTIITTNYTGDKLVDRFQNKETGVALVRRLRDYFVAISA